MVTEVVSTMQEIEASSRKIADIIGVINGIAFQTNILALNAAVEAARAGEQGRGIGIGMMHGAVHELDSMTQQNAALVEESAAAATSLSQEARQLLDAVEVFRLGDEAHGGRMMAA